MTVQYNLPKSIESILWLYNTYYVYMSYALNIEYILDMNELKTGYILWQTQELNLAWLYMKYKLIIHVYTMNNFFLGQLVWPNGHLLWLSL